MAIQFNLPSYDVEALIQMDTKLLRQEYSRLRSIARKRLERLAKDKIGVQSAAYRDYKKTFTALPDLDIAAKSILAKKLSDVDRFLNMKQGTVSGLKKYRKQQIDELHKKGFTWVNEKNLDKFWEYLEFNRALKKGGLYDSFRIMEMLQKADQKGIKVKMTQDDFVFWMNNIDKTDKIPQAKGKRSSAQWRKLVEQTEEEIFGKK